MSKTLQLIIRYLDFRKISEEEKQEFVSIIVYAGETDLKRILYFITHRKDGIEIFLQNALAKREALANNNAAAWDEILQQQATLLSQEI